MRSLKHAPVAVASFMLFVSPARAASQARIFLPWSEAGISHTDVVAALRARDAAVAKLESRGFAVLDKRLETYGVGLYSYRIAYASLEEAPERRIHVFGIYRDAETYYLDVASALAAMNAAERTLENSGFDVLDKAIVPYGAGTYSYSVAYLKPDCEDAEGISVFKAWRARHYYAATAEEVLQSMTRSAEQAEKQGHRVVDRSVYIAGGSLPYSFALSVVRPCRP
ncbi:MAG: hypothetical protein HY078_03630 [Elusimicrobia bacterium]|nr:hypothetical protein [Elusimicrobiota bacterium]